MLFKRKNIFDILREAEEDENTTTDSGAEADSAPASEKETSTDTTDDGADDEFGSDDDFNIDTNLDTDTSDEGGSDDSGSSSDSSSTSLDSSSSGDGEEETSEEVVKTNADIFSSLTAEEQQIKIKELKKMFNDLYCSIDDLSDKINEIPTDEYNIDTLERISTTMYNLKIYMSTYITNIFSNKTYIENDVAFNRFLSIINTITTIINDLNKKNEENN